MTGKKTTCKFQKSYDKINKLQNLLNSTKIKLQIYELQHKSYYLKILLSCFVLQNVKETKAYKANFV